MATNYFEKFPRILYSLDDLASGQVVPDILRRVAAVNELKSNSSYFDEYDIKDGDTPEILADKIYGDSGLHWIILLINEIVDPRFDWPLPYDDFISFCIAKYGSLEAIYDTNKVVGFGEKELEVDSLFLVLESSTNKNPVRLILNKKDSDVSYRKALSYAVNPLIEKEISNFDYEYEKNEAKRRIKLIKPEFISEIITNFDNLIKK
jgi:hypothetical protein